MYGRKRPNDFHLRLSDAEYADLLEKAARVGIGPQAYIHAVLQGKELKEKPTAELIEIRPYKCSLHQMLQRKTVCAAAEAAHTVFVFSVVPRGAVR